MMKPQHTNSMVYVDVQRLLPVSSNSSPLQTIPGMDISVNSYTQPFEYSNMYYEIAIIHILIAFSGSSYCQMIRAANKVKRLDWATEYIHEAETGFRDVIWTDECNVQLEKSQKIVLPKIGELPRNKPR